MRVFSSFLVLAAAVSRAEGKAYPDVKGPIAVRVSSSGELSYIEAVPDGSLTLTPIQWDISELQGWCCGNYGIAGDRWKSNILWVVVNPPSGSNESDLYKLDLDTGVLTWILTLDGRTKGLGSDCDGYLHTTTYIPGQSALLHQIDTKLKQPAVVSTTSWTHGGVSRDFAWTPTSSNTLLGELWSTKSSGGNPPHLKIVNMNTGVEYYDTSSVGFVRGLAMDLRAMAVKPNGPTVLFAVDQNANFFQVDGEVPGDNPWTPIDLGVDNAFTADLANVPGYCFRINPSDPYPGDGGSPGGGDDGDD